MQALRFVISGKLAQFRRFYSNSSSLSYPIPPPPTLRGLLGAAMGLGPEYAERLGGLRFSVRPLSPWRFLMQTANHLKVKKGELNLAGGEHTQIPLQFVAPRTLEGRLRYEVVAVGPDAPRLAEALARPRYPLSLGPAYALAQVEEVEALTGQEEKAFEGPILGPLRADAIASLSGSGRLLTDRYPLRLKEDRTPLSVADLVIEAEGKPIAARYEGEVFVTKSGVWSLVG